MQNASSREDHPSGLALTFGFIAAALLIVTGMILFIYGFSAMLADVGRSTDVGIHIGPKLWGIIHIFGGVFLCIAGGNLFLGRPWARVVGIVMAILVVLGAAISADAYTFWAIPFVIFNLAIIWALWRHGDELGVMGD
jgi:hypothetical protein